MKLVAAALLVLIASSTVRAEIGVISPIEAHRLIENAPAAAKPIVLDTRGGYKDYLSWASADGAPFELRYACEERTKVFPFSICPMS